MPQRDLSTRSQQGNTFFGGAAILAVGIMVVKIIGMFYKIPLINIIGDQGTADFYNAYSIYSVLLTISTAGLPVAVSKMVSEANTLGHHNQVKKIFRLSMILFLSLGTLSFLILHFFSPQLAAMMQDTMAAPGIKALAPAVICVGCLSAFRGYSQGHSNMTPTAISQILEAVTKLVLGLSLASVIMKMDFTTTHLQQLQPNLDITALTSEELALALSSNQTSFAAAGAIMGVTVGTIIALAYMLITFLTARSHDTRRSSDVPQDASTILHSLLKIAIPITFGSAMVGIVTVIDTALVQGQLQNALGVTENVSRVLYGNYAGALNIYNLPLALMVAITASVIPAVSACRARRDRRGSTKIIASALRVSSLIALPMGVGLFALGTPIMAMLFPTLNADIAGPLLSILGIASIFVCLMLVCNSILQAYNFMNIASIIMVIGGAVKIFANYNLVAIPDIGIYGAPVGNILCFGLCFVLDIIVIARVIPNRPAFAPIFVKPLISATAMGFGAWGVYGIASKLLAVDGVLSHSRGSLATLMAISIAAIIYLVLVVVLGAISKEDLSLMPKGDKIAKILRL